MFKKNINCYTALLKYKIIYIIHVKNYMHTYFIQPTTTALKRKRKIRINTTKNVFL